MVLGPRVRTTRSLLLLSSLLLAGAALSACEEQLFVADEPRSQYDRFDAVRDKRAELYIEDEFGNRRPNLRGRLLTSE
jgi:hypothetical protein